MKIFQDSSSLLTYFSISYHVIFLGLQFLHSFLVNHLRIVRYPFHKSVRSCQATKLLAAYQLDLFRSSFPFFPLQITSADLFPLSHCFPPVMILSRPNGGKNQSKTPFLLTSHQHVPSPLNVGQQENCEERIFQQWQRQCCNAAVHDWRAPHTYVRSGAVLISALLHVAVVLASLHVTCTLHTFASRVID